MSGTMRKLILLFLVVAVAGCQTLEERHKQKTFDRTLYEYQGTVRWGYLEQLYGFLQPELSENSVIPDNLRNVRVTGYDLIRPPTQVDEHIFTQTVIIRFVFVDRQVEKQITDKQLWEYNPESESWARANPIPEFK